MASVHLIAPRTAANPPTTATIPLLLRIGWHVVYTLDDKTTHATQAWQSPEEADRWRLTIRCDPRVLRAWVVRSDRLLFDAPEGGAA